MSFSKLWDNLKPLTRLRGFRFPRCIKSAEEFLQILKSKRSRCARKLARKISNAIAETDSPPACRVYTYPIHKYQSIINRFGSPAPEKTMLLK